MIKDIKVLILVLMEYAHWEDIKEVIAAAVKAVLILVLMEYAHWGVYASHNRVYFGILILVLMEYAHWENESSSKWEYYIVLILVLMEYAHWDCVGFHRVN